MGFDNKMFVAQMAAEIFPGTTESTTKARVKTSVEVARLILAETGVDFEAQEKAEQEQLGQEFPSYTSPVKES